MSNILNEQKDVVFPLTAYDELLVANSTPIIQVTAHYGIRDDILTANLGGTTTTGDSNFIVSTGGGANNVAALVSDRQISYRAGQGLRCEISAVFTQGVANNTQQAGFITSESSLGFGYNGTSFGILYANGGAQEQQELTITAGASVAENATIEVDGFVHVVALASGVSANQAACKISTYLSQNEPRYQFSYIQNVVYALAKLPDFGGGIWSFSSGTAAATWSQKQGGVNPVETWIPKADWNVNPDINIDPTKGNVYQIQMQYLGYGGMFFWIKDPATSRFSHVHTIHYENTSTVPSVSNPIFRVGWATRNDGNTSNVTVKGASAGAYIEGIVHHDGVPRGKSVVTASYTTTANTLLMIRNRLTFNEEANRAEIIPLLLFMGTESSQHAIFEIVKNPLFGGTTYPIYKEYSPNSLMTYSDTKLPYVSGEVIASFIVTAESPQQVQLNQVIDNLIPNTVYAITARVTSGASSTMVASVTWKEDL